MAGFKLQQVREINWIVKPESSPKVYAESEKGVTAKEAENTKDLIDIQISEAGVGAEESG